MNLNDDDLGALAWFLARRLTPEGRPPPPVTDLLHPVDPALLARWSATLSEAQATGRLAQVLRDAVAARPDDEALRETAGLVPGAAPRPSSDRRPAALLALAAMLLLMFGVASATTAGAVLLVGSALPVRSPEVEPAAVAVPHTSVPPIEAPAPSTVASVGIPRIEAAPAPPPVPQPALVAPARAAPSDAVRPCEEEGWFHVGRRRPKGATFVVPHAVNVRAEPPSLENRWRSDTPVRCYLRKGDVVTLDRPPADAGNGHYWVHVAPGGVVRPR